MMMTIIIINGNTYVTCVCVTSSQLPVSSLLWTQTRHYHNYLMKSYKMHIHDFLQLTLPANCV